MFFEQTKIEVAFLYLSINFTKMGFWNTLRSQGENTLNKHHH